MIIDEVHLIDFNVKTRLYELELWSDQQKRQHISLEVSLDAPSENDWALPSEKEFLPLYVQPGDGFVAILPVQHYYCPDVSYDFAEEIEKLKLAKEESVRNKLLENIYVALRYFCHDEDDNGEEEIPAQNEQQLEILFE